MTPHFSLAELTTTSTGLNNTPNEEQLSHLKALANGLESIRDLLGKPIHINSAFRSKEVNIAVGGSDNSAHLLGYAADITVNGLTNNEICKAIVRAGIKFDQLIDECSKGGQWVHISLDPKMRNQWLIFSNGKYEVHK